MSPKLIPRTAAPAPKKEKIVYREKPIPDAVRHALATILKETERRYKKYGYNGYLGLVKIVKEWFA